MRLSTLTKLLGFPLRNLKNLCLSSRHLSLLLLCLYSYTGFGQTKEALSTDPKLLWSASYVHSSTINPGFQVHGTWIFKENVKAKRKSKSGLTSRQQKRQFALATRLGFYWDPLSHISLFNQYFFSYRWVFENEGGQQKFWLLAAGFGPGYQRNFYEEVYEVDANNQVKKIGPASRGFVSSTFDLHFTRARKNKRFNAWMFGFNSTFLYNYNATIAPVNNIYFGFRFNFKPKT